MSIIQNARSKWEIKFRPDTPNRPNPYYEKFLNEMDKEFINGYDWLMEEEFPCFISSIEENDLFNVDKIDLAVVESDKDYDEYSEDELSWMTNETKIALFLRDEFTSYIEAKRDYLITSMIDAMDDEEYKENYKKVWGVLPDGEEY